MQAPQSTIPAHLLAILQGKGPTIAHSAPVVQARSTPRAVRHDATQGRIDAQGWEELESHSLTDNESATGSVTLGEL